MNLEYEMENGKKEDFILVDGHPISSEKRVLLMKRFLEVKHSSKVKLIKVVIEKALN